MLLWLVACHGPQPRVNEDGAIGPELREVDAAIEARMDDDRVPGLAACLVRDGVAVWCRGYGMADLEAERPATPQTPFLMASVSKAVVGVAAMAAVEDGRLQLDQPIGAYLPFEVVHPDEPGASITTRQLTAHVAGIADNWGALDPLYTDGDSPLPLGAFLDGYLTPGGEWYDADRNFVDAGVAETYRYSNVGAALAAYVVEEAVGQPFDAWCQERVFAPLGMEDSSWFLADLEAEPAMPYATTPDGFRATGHYGFPDYPDGQLRSSAADMSKLVAMVERGGALDGAAVLAADSVDELTRIQFESIDRDQGLFWYRWPLHGEQVWGHNGGEWGASTEILLWPDGLGAVVLMNGEGKGGTLSAVEGVLRDAAAAL